MRFNVFYHFTSCFETNITYVQILIILIAKLIKYFKGILIDSYYGAEF